MESLERHIVSNGELRRKWPSLGGLEVRSIWLLEAWNNLPTKIDIAGFQVDPCRLQNSCGLDLLKSVHCCGTHWLPVDLPVAFWVTPTTEETKLYINGFSFLYADLGQQYIHPKNRDFIQVCCYNHPPPKNIHPKWFDQISSGRHRQHHQQQGSPPPPSTTTVILLTPLLTWDSQVNKSPRENWWFFTKPIWRIYAPSQIGSWKRWNPPPNFRGWKFLKIVELPPPSLWLEMPNLKWVLKHTRKRTSCLF